MKNLIKKLVTDSEHQYIEFEYQNIEMILSYYYGKNDFFLFLFDDFSNLCHNLSIDNQDNDLEYAVNNLVYNLINEGNLKDFLKNQIANNLSLILVLSGVEQTDEMGLYKIEENIYTSKKYVLHYNQDDLNSLNNQISTLKSESNLKQSLNELVIANSHLLKEDGSWYELLLRLFIKIPFLNFFLSDFAASEMKLESLSNIIERELTQEQKQLLMDIDTNDIKDIDFLENFILSKSTN